MNRAVLLLRRQHTLLLLLLLLLFRLPETSSFSVPYIHFPRRVVAGALGTAFRLPLGGNPEHPPAGGQQTRLIGASRLELYRQIALSLASFAPVLSGPVAATSTTAAGTEATPTYDAGEAALTSPAAKAASEIETAYAEVVAAAAGALSADSVEQGGKNSGSCNSSCGNSAGFSPWWAAATAKAVQATRASFLSKVADAFGLKNAADAIGVVYAHQSSTWDNAKLLVDRQLLLRRRGEQQKGSWSLHFLGTGAMQASVSMGSAGVGGVGAGFVPFGALIIAVTFCVARS